MSCISMPQQTLAQGLHPRCHWDLKGAASFADLPHYASLCLALLSLALGALALVLGYAIGGGLAALLFAAEHLVNHSPSHERSA